MTVQLKISTDHSLIATKNRQADGSRSIFTCEWPRRHTWRAHLAGAAAGVYGYLAHLASRDEGNFAFARASRLCDHVVPYRLVESRVKYSRRAVFFALRHLESNGLLARAIRFRNGARLLGWVVFPHHLWAVETEFGCMPLAILRRYCDHLARPTANDSISKANCLECREIRARIEELERARREILGELMSTP